MAFSTLKSLLSRLIFTISLQYSNYLPYCLAKNNNITTTVQTIVDSKSITTLKCTVIHRTLQVHVLYCLYVSMLHFGVQSPKRSQAILAPTSDNRQQKRKECSLKVETILRDNHKRISQKSYQESNIMKLTLATLLTLIPFSHGFTTTVVKHNRFPPALHSSTAPQEAKPDDLYADIELCLQTLEKRMEGNEGCLDHSELDDFARAAGRILQDMKNQAP